MSRSSSRRDDRPFPGDAPLDSPPRRGGTGFFRFASDGIPRAVRAPRWIRGIDLFIPESIKLEGPDALRRARLAIAVTAVALVTIAWTATEESILGNPIFPKFAAGLVPVVALLPLVLRRTGSLEIVGNLFAGIAFLVASTVTIASGGSYVGVLVFLPIVPAVAVLIAGPRSGMAWMVLTCAMLGITASLSAHGISFPIQADPEFVTAAKFRVTGVIVVWTSVITLLHERLKSAALVDLASSEARYRSLAESSPLGILASDLKGSVIAVNGRLGELLGRDGTSSVPVTNVLADPGMRSSGIAALFERALASGEPVEGELEVDSAEGSKARTLRLRLAPLRSPHHRAYGAEALIEDVTDTRRADRERARFEEQIRHTQKLETLGLAASRIAHDFNSLLTSIAGNTELLLRKVPPTDPRHERVKRIELATHHAAQFTSQLLEYAGQGERRMEELDLSTLVADLARLLETGIPTGVHLETELAPDLPLIRADLGQVRQVAMNLVTNAGDAIGSRGGTVRVQTYATHHAGGPIPGGYLRDPLPAGTYSVLEVADDGVGIDPGTLERIFDPFFTTKANGRGLGLSALVGIVRSHHGALHVESALGSGSCFRIYWPCADAQQSSGLGLKSTAPSIDRAEPLVAP